MVSIKGSTIHITKGDTLDLVLDIRYADGSQYEVQEGDVIRFALKKKITDAGTVIVKEIPTENLRLRLEAEETKKLRADWTPYVYDIQLTSGDGTVNTFIDKGRLFVTDEVE